MHPKPSADTSKPLVPSFRFCIVVLLVSRWCGCFQEPSYGSKQPGRFPDPADFLPNPAANWLFWTIAKEQRRPYRFSGAAFSLLSSRSASGEIRVGCSAQASRQML
jgi:hypothetical protein